MNQEPKYFQELHRSTAPHHHSTTVIPQETTADAQDKYNSAKRQSPLSPSSSFEEPSSRKATVRPLSSTSTPTDAAAADYHLTGFTKLPLPQSFTTATPPHLRRTVSEPVYSVDTINYADPPMQLSEFPTSPGTVSIHPPQEISNGNAVQELSPFRNAAPVIHRTLSDPNPFSNQQVAAVGGTPPRPPVAKNGSTFLSCGESPSTKRLKRMKERMIEMRQWWDHVVREGDEEDLEYGKYNSEKIPKEESERDMQNPSQEAVWVEKNGECLVLHFKCPCGSGYQILLSGSNCYYKLTNF